MNCSTPGLPVHHQLPEFTATHVHRVSDAIQPSHPLSSPSPPAPNPSQHQSLFQWVNSSHEVAKALEGPWHTLKHETPPRLGRLTCASLRNQPAPLLPTLSGSPTLGLAWAKCDCDKAPQDIPAGSILQNTLTAFLKNIFIHLDSVISHFAFYPRRL